MCSRGGPFGCIWDFPLGKVRPKRAGYHAQTAAVRAQTCETPHSQLKDVAS
jgi:hypothetical protein